MAITEHPSILHAEWDGKFWCKHFGVTGCGETPEEAEADMWALYKAAVTPPMLVCQPKSRA